MKRPIFILGSHKSGTSLLRNLLDGHPELFVAPIETHYMQFAGLGVSYALRSSKPCKLDIHEIIDRLVQHIRDSNNVSSPTSDSDTVGLWDEQAFDNYLRSQAAEFGETWNHQELFTEYIKALQIALYGHLLSQDRFVEKSVENVEHAVLLQRWYPEACFVHIVRNPYATVVAIRKHASRGHFPYLGDIFASLNNSYDYLYKNPRLISRYLIIRYEDLVTHPKDIMVQVASFLDLPFKEILLKPTSLGKNWAGNSTSGRKLSGISTQQLSVWQKDISPLEIWMVNQLYPHVLRDYEYAVMEIPRSLLLPFSGEIPQTYLGNRFLWQVTLRLQTERLQKQM